MGWTWKDLTLAAGATDDVTYGAAGPEIDAYVFAAQGTRHVNYFNGNGEIIELWWDSNGWHHNNLSVAANAPRALTAPNGYMFDAQGTQHVNYIGDDFHIHELWWHGNRWHHNDLTNATGLPSGLGLGPGEFGVTGYVFAGQGTQHVNYAANGTGTNGHIIELWWDSNGWHHNDLTIAAGATVAADSVPRGYVFEGQGTQHVIYRGTDFHIHELWWDSNGWHHHDLTTAAGAPLAKGLANGGSIFGVSGYMFNAQGTQHVNYWGQDHHIHELWWDSSNGWHHNDLTIAAGAPAVTRVGAVPTGYAIGGAQYVVYRDDNVHATELSWVP